MPLALRPPVEPMLARLNRTLPAATGVTYEPKWDGFRCLAFVDGGDVVLQSRNGRSLQRYFPEVCDAVRRLGEVVVDGELLARNAETWDFPALMARLHPAASRVERLSVETPASYVVFDVLAVDDDDVTGFPFSERRKRLVQLLESATANVVLTPQTTDVTEATRWLDAPVGSGIDGVVVKADDLRYEPGRRVMTKVKRLHSADCVVAGVRLYPDGGIASLLLGAFDGDLLRHVGVAPTHGRVVRHEMRAELEPYASSLSGHPWELGFGLEGGALGRFKGTAGRWTPDLPRDWMPLRPERVAEVGYDHVEGWRFRHPARFLRWRPDRDPRSCTIEQLA